MATAVLRRRGVTANYTACRAFADQADAAQDALAGAGDLFSPVAPPAGAVIERRAGAPWPGGSFAR